MPSAAPVVAAMNAIEKEIAKLGIHRASGTLSLRHFTFARNFAMGAGLCYVIENKLYWHLPLALLVPSPYVGYQAYKNRGTLLQMVRETV